MRRFWIWYDKLDGLWKLLLVLLFFAIGIGAISLGFAMERHSSYLIFGGLFLILFVYSSRAWYLNKEAKSRGFKVNGRRL